jgi:hypothetical protein
LVAVAVLVCGALITLIFVREKYGNSMGGLLGDWAAGLLAQPVYP